jgi:hypothetical protein
MKTERRIEYLAAFSYRLRCAAPLSLEPAM